MGLTSNMYRSHLRELSNAVFHNWPKYKGESSIPELTTRLIGEHSIQKGDTVVGTSLGGIVACEIANQIELEKLLIVGSAVSKEKINGLLKLINPLIDFAPLQSVRISLGF